MATPIKMRVKVTEVKTATNKFLAYKALGKNKKWIDLRFTQDVENPPKEDCFIMVLPENANYTTAYQYPRIWVRKIEEIMPIERKENNIADYFDDAVTNSTSTTESK